MGESSFQVVVEIMNIGIHSGVQLWTTNFNFAASQDMGKQTVFLEHFNVQNFVFTTLQSVTLEKELLLEEIYRVSEMFDQV